MNAISGKALADMTIRMLERTAMVLAEPAPDGADSPGATRFARITYRGPSQGTLLLEATDGFLCELAAGILGVETTEVDADSQGSDALKEMANIVGGSVILALSGEVCAYSLGLPELLHNGDLTEQDRRATTSADCTVVAEGGSLRVVWHDVCPAMAA